ncbi:MAG TPA: VOC family protein [Gaiellaceae bacterium]|nr:VOC family protein [Gaiellaceae bacterium]
MKLEGIHHVTCITGDAPQNVEYYTGTLGLRLVKKSVNQDDPTVYHLFYADEKGSAGSDITFFEYPGAANGRAGAGMVHAVVWRVGSSEALDFWADRLGVARDGDVVRFEDPEGLAHELVVASVPDEPLVADHPEIPHELALQGFEGVRAYTPLPATASAAFLERIGFELRDGTRWETRGDKRGGWIAYDEPPAEPGRPGAGTVHHVAWASELEDEEAWRTRVAEAGGRPTPVIDRFWFRSVYFREPSGVLFEIATLGPGFDTDEDLAHLGEKLILPPDFEHLRAQVEPILTPLPDPRESWTRA